MTSCLPNEFRVLRHVERIYAQELPMTLCFSTENVSFGGAEEEKGTSENTHGEDNITTAAIIGTTTASQRARMSSSMTSTSSSTSVSSTSSDSDDQQTTHGPRSSPAGRHRSITCSLSRAPDSFFVLRTPHLTESCSLVYVSEVFSHSRHPTWRGLPAHITSHCPSPSLFWLELYYTPACLSVGAHEDARAALIAAHVRQLSPRDTADTRGTHTSSELSLPQSGILIQRVCVPLAALVFLGTDVSLVEAEMPPVPLRTALVPRLTSSSSPMPLQSDSEERTQGRSETVSVASMAGSPLPFHLLLQCTDGVYGYSPAEAQKILLKTASSLRTVPLPAPQPHRHGHGTVVNSSGNYHRASRGAASSMNVAWLRSPAGESPYLTQDRRSRLTMNYPDTVPSAVTAGDLKVLSTASLAWQTALQIGQARRQAALSSLDAHAAETESERQRAARLARLQQTVGDEQEALTVLTLRVEALRQAVAERETKVQTLRSETAQLTHAAEENPERAVGVPQEMARQQELRRADVRAKLGEARRTHMATLRSLFPIDLASEREYGSAAYRTTRRAKDSIAGCMLPVAVLLGGSRSHGDGRSGSEPLTFLLDRSAASVRGAGSGAIISPSSSSTAARLPLLMRTSARLTLAPSTADEAHEEALALAHVAHVLTLLSVLYGCPLPHPVLLAGAHTRVLVRAEARPADVVPPVTSTGALVLSAGAAALLSSSSSSLISGNSGQTVPVPQHSLPVMVGKSADQPLVAAAVQLLHRDAMVVAERMGLTTIVEPLGLRLGAVVDALLLD